MSLEDDASTLNEDLNYFDYDLLCSNEDLIQLPASTQPLENNLQSNNDRDEVPTDIDQCSQMSVAETVNMQLNVPVELEKNPNIVRNNQVESSTSLEINDLINNISAQKKRKKIIFDREDKSSIRCKCKKSQCIQLYCECLAAGLFCSEECDCKSCINQEIYEDIIQNVKLQIISKNPSAFAPKKVEENGVESSLSRHKRGCKCKKSMCRQKYCECFQARISCTITCGCECCHNPFGGRLGGGIPFTSNIVEENIPNKNSSTYSSNISSLKDHTPTSNITNGGQNHEYNDEASLDLNITSSIYELLQVPSENNHSSLQLLMMAQNAQNEMLHNIDHQPLMSFPSPCTNNPNHCGTAPLASFPTSSNFAPQPCVGMMMMQPPNNNHLDLYQSPSTYNIGEGSSSSSSLRADLRSNNNQQEQDMIMRQNMPNFAASFPCNNNFNESSAQNGDDHINFSG